MLCVFAWDRNRVCDVWAEAACCCEIAGIGASESNCHLDVDGHDGTEGPPGTPLAGSDAQENSTIRRIRGKLP